MSSVHIKFAASYLPQKGIPSGVHWSSAVHTRLAGPNSSNPLSHAYVATVPTVKFEFEKKTEECAGEPGKRHACGPETRNYY